MVSSTAIRSSNAHLSTTPNLTFVFAGATAGIGLSTLKAFAKHAVTPTAYIIGRSKARFQPHLDELAKINPGGKWVFLEGQFTLLKEGKRLADEIVKLESQKEGGGKVDALITSTGYLTFVSGREDTEEGIDANGALIYYNRILLTRLLLPLLSASPHGGRVVSVFNSTGEGRFTLEELQSEFRLNFARLRYTFAHASLTDLSFEQLAKQYPRVSFVHSYPGFVQTNIAYNLFDTAKGLWAYPAWAAKKFIAPLLWLIFYPVTVGIEESGEMHLFEATSAAYPAKAAAETQGGVVPLVQGVDVKRSSLVGEDGKGSGVYRTRATGESAHDTKALDDLRREGLDVAGWRETVKLLLTLMDDGKSLTFLEVEDLYARAPIDSILPTLLVQLCVWGGGKEALTPSEDAPQGMLRELVTEFQKKCDPGAKSPFIDVRNYYVVKEGKKEGEKAKAI